MNVYDFDNTIYDGETLVDFILYYVRTDPRIWRYVPKLLVIAFKDAFHLFTVAQALEAYASFLEGYYVKVEHIEEDVVKFGTAICIRLSPGTPRCSGRMILLSAAPRTFCWTR